MESAFNDQKLDITPLITPEIKMDNNRIVFTFKMGHILEQILPVTEAFLPENGRKLEISVSLDQNDDLVIQATRGSGKKGGENGDEEDKGILL